MPLTPQTSLAQAGRSWQRGWSHGNRQPRRPRATPLLRGCAPAAAAPQTAVTCLRFSPGGALLASGSKDTELVVWDVLGEAGLFRLRGHKDQVTDVVSPVARRRSFAVAVLFCGSSLTQ